MNNHDLAVLHRFNAVLDDMYNMTHTDNEGDLVDLYIKLNEKLYLFYKANSIRITDDNNKLKF